MIEVRKARRAAAALALALCAAPGQAQQGSGPPELSSLEVEALLLLAHQVQGELEAQLLAVDPRWLEEYAELVERPDAGVVRLLDHGQSGALREVTRTPGNGTTFSFATGRRGGPGSQTLLYRSSGWDADFHGGQAAILLDLGTCGIREVPAGSEQAPPGFDADRARDWAWMFEELDFEATRTREFRDRARQLEQKVPAAAQGRAVAVRNYTHREHDVLAAFEVLEVDERGCTIAWRVLRTWPVAEARPLLAPEPDATPPAPAWLTDLGIDAQLSLLRELRVVGEGKLLAVPEETRARFLEVVQRRPRSFADRAGFARILHRGVWSAVVASRGGGAYLSFLDGTNDYDGPVELGLQQGGFYSGFAGRQVGLLLDLGEVPFEELGALYDGAAPSGLSERQRETWDWMHTVRAEFDPERGERELPPEDRARADAMRRGAPALHGHSYLLRSVLFDSHDHLVVFTVVGEDPAGLTLAWRVLDSWPVER